MTRSQQKPPWKRRNPAKHRHTKLSDADKERARARAAKAGRRYPNLIDNMYVAQHKRAGRS